MGQRARHGREDKTALMKNLEVIHSDSMDFKTVFNDHPRAMMVTDSEPRILYVNRAFKTITGYPAERVIGEKPSVLSSGYHDHRFYQALWDSLLKERRWEGLVWNQRANGELYPQWLNIFSIETQGQQRFVGTFMDVGDLSRLEEKLASYAYYDVLTRLPNRYLFLSYLESRCHHQENHDAGFCVLFMDLDFFKTINDIHGHAHGDELLICIARRLQGTLRQGDILARLSGDEFAAIVEVNETGAVEQFCLRIIQLLKTAITVGEQRHYISVSIGVSLYSESAQESSILLEQADQAMYVAKKTLGSSFQVFERSQMEHTLNEQRIAELLVHSINESVSEFSVLYQPHYMITTGELTGIEALVRWRHPEWGEVSPGSFIPIAEKRGCIARLTELILQQIQTDLETRRFHLPMGIRLAINVSARHLLEPCFITMIQQMQSTVQSVNWELEIEITETTLAELGEQLKDQLSLLRQSGIRIAIDDFGTGYSSLAYLQEMSVDVLKIDRRFIDQLAQPHADTRLIEAILSLGRTLNMEVVAEGIETDSQRQILCALGCQHGQGFGLAKPQPWGASLFHSLKKAPIEF
ncbi:MAG: putative bifunctional diguanylate cyclase/phosphodiesterase [Saccharospirillum sp.]